MIGDFHGSTNALWSLYGKEAQSYDKSRVEPLKDDMDGVLIFVRLYFALLKTDSLMHTFTGRFILRCAHIIRG